MCAVSSAECVVYENVCKGAELLGKSFAVLGLFCSVAGVLKKNYVAVLHSGNSGLCVLAYNVVVSGKNYFLTEVLRKSLGNGSKRKLGLGLSLRLAEVRAKDYLTAVGDKLLNGGEGCNDSVFVGDNAAFKGNVKIATNENALAFYVNVIYCLFVKCCHFKSSFRMIKFTLLKNKHTILYFTQKIQFLQHIFMPK